MELGHPYKTDALDDQRSRHRRWLAVLPGLVEEQPALAASLVPSIRALPGDRRVELEVAVRGAVDLLAFPAVIAALDRALLRRFADLIDETFAEVADHLGKPEALTRRVGAIRANAKTALVEAEEEPLGPVPDEQELTDLFVLLRVADFCLPA